MAVTQGDGADSSDGRRGLRSAAPPSPGRAALEGELPLAVNRWARAALPRYPTSSREPFAYALAPPPEVKAARAWRPGSEDLDGCSANALVTLGYHALDQACADYLGDPPIAVWLTFAKYASRDVGGWIRLVEGFLTVGRAVRRNEGSAARRLRAGRALVEGLLVERVHRAMSLGTALRAPPLALLRPLLIVRDALVEANTEIFSRIALAFHVFLEAEARGEDGALAVTALSRAGRLEDPMGHLAGSAARYRRARQLGLAARAPGCARGDRQVLLALRRQLVEEANWLIAIQEQALIQRPTIFGHPVLGAFLGGARPGELSVSLARGDTSAPSERFTLLPEGGNWANYATRMGFREVDMDRRPEDAVVVSFPGAAGLRAFVPDLSRSGTILDMFSKYLEGPSCERLRHGAPRPIAPVRV